MKLLRLRIVRTQPIPTTVVRVEHVCRHRAVCRCVSDPREHRTRLAPVGEGWRVCKAAVCELPAHQLRISARVARPSFVVRRPIKRTEHIEVPTVHAPARIRNHLMSGPEVATLV